MKRLLITFSHKAVAWIGLLAILAAFLIFVNVYAAGFDTFCEWLVGVAINKLGEAGPLLAALALGISAFLIHGMYFTRIIYAAIEICFGVLGAEIALSLLYRPELLRQDYKKLLPDGTKFSIYVALGSSVYVIVRGLDNWFKWFVEDVQILMKLRRKMRGYFRFD